MPNRTTGGSKAATEVLAEVTAKLGSLRAREVDGVGPIDSPKRASVQRLAAVAIQLWRDPQGSRHLLPREPMTYREIGEALGVGEERARQLHEKLVGR